MRFMMILKADERTEAGEPPTEEALEAMATYNEELAKAGVLLDGAGLQPSSKGARVVFEDGETRVIDGPFAETKELIAGYWMIRVDSKDEAIAWARKIPFEHTPERDGRHEVELRRMYELEDFEPGDAIEHHREVMTEIGKEP